MLLIEGRYQPPVLGDPPTVNLNGETMNYRSRRFGAYGLTYLRNALTDLVLVHDTADGA